MNYYIYKIVKNNKGSSLSFVIIISMVIMVMVGSLLAIANSGLFFTQESVESRQAYIDAKSVIERGKVEINTRMTLFKEEEQGKKIGDGNETIFYILASKDEEDRNQGLNSLNLRLVNQGEAYDEEVLIPVGVGTLSWLETTEEIDASTGITLATTVYTFKIETQNLRRKLDYTADFTYEIKKTKGTAIIPPEMPEDRTSSWNGTKIHTAGWKSVIMNIAGYGNIKEKWGTLAAYLPGVDLNIEKFDWLNGKVLDLMAQNIGITTKFPTQNVWGGEFNLTATNELRFKENYVQKNGASQTNNFKAKDIIFEGDLKIEYGSNLNIECDNLWVRGKIIVDTGVTYLPNTIKAKNIIIGEDKSKKKSGIEVKNASELILKADNVWVYGDIETKSSNTSLDFNEINFLETGKIKLGQGSDLWITGKENQTNNQVNMGKLETKSSWSNNHQVRITNLALFSCEGLELTDFSTLQLESRVVKIDGDLYLGFMDWPIEITTEYFEVTGKTEIKRLYGDMNINAMNNVLNVRFAKGYKQINSRVFINSGDIVVFGGKVELLYDNPYVLILNVSADNIYLDTTLAEINKETQFIYSGKLGGSLTNLSLNPNPIVMRLNWQTVKTILPGKYSNVKGRKLEELTIQPTSYSPPNFPNPPEIPGGSGGEETVEINIKNLQTEYD